MNKERMMRRLSAVLIVCATLGMTTGLAHAGDCTDQIVQLRQAPESGLQAQSEPPGQGRSYRQLMFSAELVRASALDALGHEDECSLTVRRARLELQNDG